jgi:hypothetical protein
MSELKPGDKVRGKTNPSRVGILTSEVDGLARLTKIQTADDSIVSKDMV